MYKLICNEQVTPKLLCNPYLNARVDRERNEITENCFVIWQTKFSNVN